MLSVKAREVADTIFKVSGSLVSGYDPTSQLRMKPGLPRFAGKCFNHKATKLASKA